MHIRCSDCTLNGVVISYLHVEAAQCSCDLSEGAQLRIHPVLVMVLLVESV